MIHAARAPRVPVAAGTAETGTVTEGVVMPPFVRARPFRPHRTFTIRERPAPPVRRPVYPGRLVYEAEPGKGPGSPPADMPPRGC